jgi:hypothetical protein
MSRDGVRPLFFSSRTPKNVDVVVNGGGVN